MKQRSTNTSWLVHALLLLFLLPATALADPSPAVQKVGSEAAARHMVTHEGAFTDGIVDMVNLYNRDDEHIRCTGTRVSLWDTPQKGTNTGHLYPGSQIGTLEKNSEFELIAIEFYRGKYYANVRLYQDGHPLRTGWVNADYIACSCTDWSEGEDVPEYEPVSLSFHLR